MDIKYKLDSIAETEFKINYDFDYSKLNPEKLQIRIGHDIKPLMEKNQIVVKAKALLVFSEGDIELATNTLMMYFDLSPIKDIIKLQEEGKFSTQNTIVLDTFLIATVGALRGVLMKNLKGTPLEPYFLPLIPMEKFRIKDK